MKKLINFTNKGTDGREYLIPVSEISYIAFGEVQQEINLKNGRRVVTYFSDEEVKVIKKEFIVLVSAG